MSTPPVSAAASEDRSEYSLREQFLLWLISWVGYVGIRLIGVTLRYSVCIEEGGPKEFFTRPLILCFWHRSIFPATYFFRRQQIGVITSRSFDGEYIARVIAKFGYVPIRGSSSRGGARALLEGRRRLEQGYSVAATTDGPRGPVYVAKPGPVLLASKSGMPLVAFHIALEEPWLLSTWDKFMIPRPFSRAFLCMSRQIVVPPDADEAQMERFHAELQAAQERVREMAEAKLGGGH